MSKAFSRNETLNKIIKDIYKMEDKKMTISINTDNISYSMTIDSKTLVNYTLKNYIFLDMINGGERLLCIYLIYHDFFILWSDFNSNYDNRSTSMLKKHLNKEDVSIFIKARKGEIMYLSIIKSIISAFYIIRLYFDKSTLYKLNNNNNKEFILEVLE